MGFSVDLLKFDIVYRPGKCNGNADAMSRLPDSDNQVRTSTNKRRRMVEVANDLCSSSGTTPVTFDLQAAVTQKPQTVPNDGDIASFEQDTNVQFSLCKKSQLIALNAMTYPSNLSRGFRNLTGNSSLRKSVAYLPRLAPCCDNGNHDQ